MSSTDQDGDPSRSGSGGMCCGGDCKEAPMMSFVGRGRGEYAAVTTYQYVGEGAGEFSEVQVATSIPPNFICMASVAALGVFAVIALLLWLLFSRGSGTGNTTPFLARDSIKIPYDCAAGFSNWKMGWSEGQKVWCCDHYGRGCPTTTTACQYDCDAGYSNWRRGWAGAKKTFCCRAEGKGCPNDPHPR